MAVSGAVSVTAETSSAEGLDEEPVCRAEAKWKRFHPFRVVRKIFRRRVKRQGTEEGTDTSKKSWSTSELQSVQDTSEKYEVPSPPYKIGLSVSHDSIFSPESSNLIISEELNRPQGSSLSVQHVGIKNMFQDELFSRVHARRDSEDDEDVGLPHSPCTSPTTIDVLAQGLKVKPLQSGSLSAGSLVSMGSSENDEDSAVASSSGNSSRASLLDRRTVDFESDPDFHQTVHLNHNAARHKISVRPKRTYGLPQKRLKQQLAASRLATLPTTLEVIEDIGKTNSKFESHEVFTASTVYEKVVSTSEDSITSQHVKESLSETVNSQSLTQSVLIETCTSQDGPALPFSEVSSDTVENHASASHVPDNLPSAVSTEYVQKDVSKYADNAGGGLSEINSEETMTCIKKEIHEAVQYTESSSSENRKVSTLTSSKLVTSDVSAKAEMQGDNMLKEAPLRVSALIKNIERSDSFVKQGKDKISSVTSKAIETESEVSSISTESKVDSLLNDTENATATEKAIKPDDTCSDLNLASYDIEKSHSIAKTCSDKKDTISGNNQVIPDGETYSKKPSQSKLHSEIRHHFQQQNVVKSREQCPGTSRLFSEEESIMSEKFVHSMYNAEDSHVFISHQIPDAVEAHNLVTVDKSFMANVHSHTTETGVLDSHDTLVCGRDSFTENSDNISNIMVHSMTSSTSNQRINEERVTISVNSLLEESKAQDSETVEKTKLPMLMPTLSSSEDAKISIAHSQTSKLSKTGSKSPVIEKVAQMKDDPAKRLSVEIVPFSQRIKDKKYQPLLFSNKSDTKSNCGTVVERNLSDRRSSGKAKDLEKNNRHSFSGSLSVEVEKTGVLSEKKPPGKVDKVHYPVQIRIHKNKTYEKENQFDKTKVSSEVKKPSSPDPISDGKCLHTLKTVREGLHAKNPQAKWEVKVHSTSHVKRGETSPKEQSDLVSTDGCLKIENASHHSQVNEPKGCSSQPLAIQKSIPEKTSPTSSLIESALLKNRENTRKSSKDAEDPEPELLRVFARRSIKQKHCDKEKVEDHPKDAAAKVIPPNSLFHDKSAEGYIQPAFTTSPLDAPVSKTYDTPEPFKSSLKSPDLVKKKSKSFCEKEKQGPHIVTPLKEVGLNRRPSLILASPESSNIEMFHQRQRLVSEPNIASVLPPATDTSTSLQNTMSSESAPLTSLHRGTPMSTSPSSTLSNGSSVDVLKGKDNQDLNNKDGSAPSWLQLAQQRRELREQRERLLIGSSANSFLDVSSKPSRSSKVWDMVNNFQKMQMT